MRDNQYMQDVILNLCWKTGEKFIVKAILRSVDAVSISHSYFHLPVPALIHFDGSIESN